MDEMGKDPRQPSEAYPGDTIGSLMAECELLEQYIGGERTGWNASCWRQAAQVTHLTA